MKDGKKSYACSNCNERFPKWAGQCPACQEWNTLTEAAVPLTKAGRGNTRAASSIKLSQVGSIPRAKVPRICTGIDEFDRVLGGGFVPGSAVIISGDPGVGKSTLLLQALSALALQGRNVAYISAEESQMQVQDRADRLGVGNTPLLLAHDRDAGAIAELIRSEQFDVIVVDSIQTVMLSQLDATPGSPSQIKTCASELIAAAKDGNTAIVFVGHVTKSSEAAGPQLLYHLCDGNLSLFADASLRYRLFRASKNRFGPADEIGVFEMNGDGMNQVVDPAGIFIADRQPGLSGCVVFPSMEGSRPMLLEIQALVTPNPNGNPRRVSLGFDNQRLSMILAVIDARLDIPLHGHDVFLNVAGGYKITEPAADLAVACAIMSAYTKTPFDEKAVAMGEIGLGGEIRPVPRTEQRIKEAEKLGFTDSFIPDRTAGATGKATKVKHLKIFNALFETKGLKAA